MAQIERLLPNKAGICLVTVNPVVAAVRDEHVDIEQAFIRPADPMRIRGNPAKAERELGWRAKYGIEDVAREMLAA